MVCQAERNLSGQGWKWIRFEKASGSTQTQGCSPLYSFPPLSLYCSDKRNDDGWGCPLAPANWLPCLMPVKEESEASPCSG